MALDRSGARGTTDGLRRDRVRGVPLNGHAISGVPGRFMGFVTAAPTTFEGYMVADFVINSVSGHFYVLINFSGTLLWIDGTNTAVIPEANVTGLVADLAKKENFTVCTSGTRPGSPAIGDSIFETDTGNHLRWYGATPAWYPAVWDSAWGAVAAPLSPAGFSTASTTLVDLTGSTISWTAIANRRYEVLAVAATISSTVAGDVAQLDILDTSGDIGNCRGLCAVTSNSGMQLTRPSAVTPGAATAKIQVKRVSGTGTITFGNSLIRVMDIGPSGAPV